MLYECSGPSFRDIKNPYTGEQMPVKMLVAPGGRLLFASPGAYHPGGSPQGTARAAFRLWDREDGVEGVRSARGPVVCAWTGRPLSPMKTADGWVYSGGFDPTAFRPRDEFLYYATMRAGKATRPAPAPEAARIDQPPRRGEVTDGMRRGAEERGAEPDEETLAAAAAIAKSAGAESPAVSMYVSGKGRGKGRK